VDETDIGKIAAGMPVTITVDAFPNRPFYGQVLKIEPLATTTQNVTMFTVLIRIPNPGLALKPGMNTEVDIHVGQRDSVLAVPNAALRTPQDVASAASVLGLDMQQVQEQLAAQRDTAQGGEASMGGTTANDSSKANGNTITMANGRTVTIPEGVTKAQAQEVVDFMTKLRSGGGFQNMSDADRAKMQQLRPIMEKLFPRNGGGRGGRGERGGDRSAQAGDSYQFGGTYTVFVLRDGRPHAVRIQTGLTDLDYAEVKSGLKDGDTVLVLPSASLLASQQQFQQRVAGRGGLPGVQRNSR